MTLAELTTAAVLALAGQPSVDAVAERPRLEALAVAIAGAVDARHELDDWLPGSVAPLPWRGPTARQRAALALVAIAYHESGFRADVSDCRRVGYAEPSITAFQLHGPWAWGGYSKRELCRSPRLAAERALAVLAHHAKRCGTARAFQGYASGDCSRGSGAARRQEAIWRRLVARWVTA